MSHYAEIIEEEVSLLLELEKKEKHPKKRERLMFLRILKQGWCDKIEEASELVGISKATGYRIWKNYREHGIDEMCVFHYKGRPCEITKEGELAFLKEANEKGFQSLKHGRLWLKENFGREYSLVGVWMMCKRLKIKLKAKRPRHANQSQEALEAFKKSSQR